MLLLLLISLPGTKDNPHPAHSPSKWEKQKLPKRKTENNLSRAVISQMCSCLPPIHTTCQLFCRLLCQSLQCQGKKEENYPQPSPPHKGNLKLQETTQPTSSRRTRLLTSCKGVWAHGGGSRERGPNCRDRSPPRLRYHANTRGQGSLDTEGGERQLAAATARVPESDENCLRPTHVSASSHPSRHHLGRLIPYSLHLVCRQDRDLIPANRDGQRGATTPQSGCVIRGGEGSAGVAEAPNRGFMLTKREPVLVGRRA